MENRASVNPEQSNLRSFLNGRQLHQLTLVACSMYHATSHLTKGELRATHSPAHPSGSPTPLSSDPAR